MPEGENTHYARIPSPPRVSPTRARRPPARGPHRFRFGAVLLALALLATGGLYVQLGKTVTLVIDGDAREARTFSADVAAFLDDQGLEIGEHDKVKPGLGTPLDDGATVRVQIAKEITLVLNGEPQSIYVTGQTVDEVLAQVNFRSGNKAYVRPSRSSRIEEGDTIVLREAVKVHVKVDDIDEEIITNAPDVGYLMVSMGILLKKEDRITPSTDTPLSPGMSVVVTRVRFKEVTESKAIPFRTEERPTDALVKGTSRVDREGQAGVEELRYRLRLENGDEADRVLLGREVVRQPVSRVVLIGTRDPNVETGIASWYHRTGMVAAHKTLPFGTVVKVTNLANGATVTVTINDRGPYVDGRIIDLSDDAFAKLAPLGSGTANVRISW